MNVRWKSTHIWNEFWIICALPFLVSSLDLHYQIIENSLYANSYYNNCNLAARTPLNYFFSCETTDLLILMTSLDGCWAVSWGLLPASTTRSLIMISPSCSPVELPGKDDVAAVLHCRVTTQEPDSLWQPSMAAGELNFPQCFNTSHTKRPAQSEKRVPGMKIRVHSVCWQMIRDFAQVCLIRVPRRSGSEWSVDDKSNTSHVL